jgi:hypothetical protein
MDERDARKPHPHISNRESISAGDFDYNSILTWIQQAYGGNLDFSCQQNYLGWTDLRANQTNGDEWPRFTPHCAGTPVFGHADRISLLRE